MIDSGDRRGVQARTQGSVREGIAALPKWAIL
jgi:hypothetical protein